MQSEGYAVTVFPSSRETLPCAERVGLGWRSVVSVYAEKLIITRDKTRVPYTVPCQLKEGPFVGKTAERMAKLGPSIGKQRSASHVTEARLLVFDFDGLIRAEMQGVLVALRGLMCLCLVYSSYSHGNPEKPGARFRVVIALDRLVEGREYTTLWTAINEQVFDSLADPSSRHMYQQQGVWASHPDWADKAFKFVGHGEPLVCDRWHTAKTAQKTSAPRATPTPIAGNSRISAALRWIDANDTGTWQQIGMALKALEPELGADALSHWLAFSESAEDTAKKQNNDSRYNPLTMWESFTPTMPMEAAQGKLFALARDGAAAALNKSIKTGELSSNGREAVAYLEARHPRYLSSMLADAGIGGDV